MMRQQEGRERAKAEDSCIGVRFTSCLRILTKLISHIYGKV